MGTGETAFFAANFAVEVRQIQGDASMFLEIMPATSSPGGRFLVSIQLRRKNKNKFQKTCLSPCFQRMDLIGELHHDFSQQSQVSKKCRAKNMVPSIFKLQHHHYPKNSGVSRVSCVTSSPLKSPASDAQHLH